VNCHAGKVLDWLLPSFSISQPHASSYSTPSECMSGSRAVHLREAVTVVVLASLAVLRIATHPAFKRLRFVWRPSGSLVSIAARATAAIGIAGLVLGFVFAIQTRSPRWALPLLWSGFALTMLSAFFVGYTSASPEAVAVERPHKRRS